MNLPRMSKLCIGIFEKRKNSNVHPLLWVNAYVFDYKSTLRWRDTLQMWRYSMGETMPTHEEVLSPLQHAICNPDLKEAADIIVTYGPFSVDSDDPELSSTPHAEIDEADFPHTPEKRPQTVLIQQHKIEFPPFMEKDECPIGDESITYSDDGSVTSSSSTSSIGSSYVSKNYTQDLEKIADRDPMHDVTVQEKELIWRVREYCCLRLPHLLPRVIDCVDYADPSQVAELHTLLKRWPLLAVERALQLLDYAYLDQVVRRFAVTCLRKHATDSDVLLYLLQLAQALKHEPYLFSDLVEFLLERALNNQHIGHYLFWQLRAEMNSDSAASLLYGLILETYLVAAPEHSKLLGHQTSLLDKCKAVAISINKLELMTKSYDKAKNRFAAATKNQFQGYNPYRNFINPLNPNQKCKRIRLSKCQLMNSKTRPQMLAFENANNRHPIIGPSTETLAERTINCPDLCCLSFKPWAKDILIMFKKGDDLRQDRLTLQLITVMDQLWKDAGMDLRMKVYRCLATEKNEGLIDVVSDAETICKIQMSSAVTPTSAMFRKGSLLAWLKRHNGDVQACAMAQEQFTLSCAGYSVAAYVLGIGDRHNDNIMVRPNGQMFHIDFGHILGHFKHKFGIKRERVSMILSSEFIAVINTPEFGRPRNFERFRNLCERAYLTLRRHGCLLISLLAMMISTGLPELSSEQDLNVIRSTLNLDRSESEALEAFRREFDESLRNDWKISLDWWFHMMNQARTTSAKPSSQA